MAIDTNPAFVDALRQSGLLGVEQLNELNRSLILRYPEPKALASQLIQTGWLTPYQVNQLFQGQGSSLVLGQYRILERLGEGGMGQVFKARHNALGRVVALKVIRKDRLGNAEAVRRFRREMHMAGQLSHPNVVNAFDADAINGTHFFAMELVEGTDLARLVREKGPLASHRACECIRQAALGLQHAHEKGVVHRDIKPSNLFVSKSPNGVVVKILDMGLARFQVSQQEETSMLSQDGNVIGTPDFMAPEQAKSSSTVDHRADIYSLGCTFFYLLAGKPPFAGVSNIEKLLKHQMDPPPAIEKLRPDVPEGVRLLLGQMLAKKAAERVQTAGAVAAALEPFCKHGTAVVNGDKVTGRFPIRGLQVALPANTPADTNAATVTSQGRLSGLPGFGQSFRSIGDSKKRWILFSIGAGVGLLALFLLILMLTSGGSSPKTNPAVSGVPGPPPTRLSPATEKKQPALEPAWRFLFTDATVIFSFNAVQARKSEVYRLHRDKLKAMLFPFGAENDSFGDGCLYDAERITIARSADDEKKYLLAYQGSLDPKRFKAFAERRGLRPFTPKESLGQVDFYEVVDGNNRLTCGFVTPTTFIVTPFRPYALEVARHMVRNDAHGVRDPEVQAALERLDDNATINLVAGGQMAFGAPQEVSTLQRATHIRVVRGTILFTEGITSEIELTAESAATVEAVESFPEMIKQAVRQGNKQVAELFDAMFSEKPVRARGNTVIVRGKLNPKQVNRLFDLFRQ